MNFDFNIDEFDFDKEFKAIANNEEYGSPDPDIQAAESAILEAESIFKNASVEIEQRRSLNEELKKKRAELEKQMTELINQQNEVKKGLDFAFAEQRFAKRKVDEARINKEVIEQRAADKAKYEKQVASYDTTRAKYFWGDKVLPHQWEGAKFLANAQRAILGDGMGLGKTITSIAALDLVGAKRILVLAQADITSNFENEIRKWAPHRTVFSARGMTKAERTTLFEHMIPLLEDFIMVINFEAWRKDSQLLAHLSNVGFDSVLIDEAHNMKDTSTLTFRGIKAITQAANKCQRCGALMQALAMHGKFVVNADKSGFPQRKCSNCNWAGESIDGHLNLSERELFQKTRTVENIWSITGTPILNKVEDLYSLLTIAEPTIFHNRNAFLREYAKLNYHTGNYEFREGGADYLLKNRLAGKYLARTMADAGITLPPQDIVYHDMDLSAEDYPQQVEIIKQLQEHAQIVMTNGSALATMEQIALLTRLRQANVWPGGIQWKMEDGTIVKVSDEVQDSIKIDKAIQIAEDAVASGMRVVVFSQFRQALIEMERRINAGDLKSVRFDGATSASTKAKIKHEWDVSTETKPEHDILLANYKVGGTGLNLTEATVTIILDREWNGGKEDQAFARTHRMGQEKDTIVHVLRVNKTVDKWLDNLITAKRDLVDGFSSAAADMQTAYLDALAKGEFAL